MNNSPTNGRIVKSPPNESGWRVLSSDRGEPNVGDSPITISRVLLNLVHVSDTHICDAQSPARVEYLDRYADPHNPISKALGTLVGTYRAQESMTTQVLESMLQAINQLDRAPVTKTNFDAVIFTGDLTDNAQENELQWFSALLSGKEVRPDSGDPKSWQGVGNFDYSESYWNPHGTPKGERDDFPRRLYGFPTIPNLLNAVRAPFYGSGLKFDWFAVHGNHDALLQGTVPPSAYLRESAVGDEKISEISEQMAIIALKTVSEIGPAAYPTPENAVVNKVTPDMSREFVSELRWSETMQDDPLKIRHSDLKKRYWRKDFAEISILALDTVNSHGGWQGSIDIEQFEWLKNQVFELRKRYVLISSHHPIQDIYNDYSKDGSLRVTGNQIENFLVKQPNVMAWICGHSHRHRMAYFGPDQMHGFWQIETGSLIDWPQQSRILEFFLDQHQQFWIASTPLNHLGSILPNPEHLQLSNVNEIAGLSRLLSVNDWQRRSGIFAIENNEGKLFDRNAIVVLPARL